MKIVKYTKQCYDYHDVILWHYMVWNQVSFYIQVSSLKVYLSMNRAHFSSSKEGSHPEQLQLLKSHVPYNAHYSKKCFHGLLFPKLCWHIRLSPNDDPGPLAPLIIVMPRLLDFERKTRFIGVLMVILIQFIVQGTETCVLGLHSSRLGHRWM